MRRLTASLLLLFALAGTIVPLAQAATASPPQACCRRMGHQCHGSTAPESQRSFHNTACCGQDCCRSLTKSQSAAFEPWAMAAFAHKIAGDVPEAPATAPQTERLTSNSTRAPPHAAIA